MKKILFLFCFAPLVVFSQMRINDLMPDTAKNTTIQKVLHNKDVSIKKEFIKAFEISNISFFILVATEIKTGKKTKGVYIDNQYGKTLDILTTDSRFAYIDEDEIDSIYNFVKTCDLKWGTKTPINRTEYTFTCKDNLRFIYTGDKNEPFYFVIQFLNYLNINNSLIPRKRSDDLVVVFKTIQEQIKNL